MSSSVDQRGPVLTLRRLWVAVFLLGVLVTAIGAPILVVRRRIAAERARIVEQARSRARETRRDFEQARDGTGAARASADETLALGLDAMEAAATRRALEPGDDEARTDLVDVAIAVGEVAADAGQWSVAKGAFDRALQASPDDPRARAARDRLQGSPPR